MFFPIKAIAAAALSLATLCNKEFRQHFVALWVAYRYWQNKFGIDHAASTVCNDTPGISNNSCTEPSVYAGITAKF